MRPCDFVRVSSFAYGTFLLLLPPPPSLSSPRFLVIAHHSLTPSVLFFCCYYVCHPYSFGHGEVYRFKFIEPLLTLQHVQIHGSVQFLRVLQRLDSLLLRLEPQ